MKMPIFHSKIALKHTPLPSDKIIPQSLLYVDENVKPKAEVIVKCEPSLSLPKYYRFPE